MAFLDIAPISGMSGTDAVASLADPAAPVVVLASSVVAEQAASSVVGATPPAEGPMSPVVVVVIAPSLEQPEAATVVFEGAAQSLPLAAHATTPNVGRTKEDVVGSLPTLTSQA